MSGAEGYLILRQSTGNPAEQTFQTTRIKAKTKSELLSELRQHEEWQFFVV